MTISLWSYSYVRIRNAFLPLPAVNERVYTLACRTACQILAVMLPPSSTYSLVATITILSEYCYCYCITL